MHETLINLLYDHYKDTFSRIRERERQRDRLFLIVLVLLGLLLLQLNHSLLLQETLTEVTLAGAKFNLSNVPTPILLSTSWIFLVVILLRYYQVVVHIEKQYDYLHPLEKRLSKMVGEKGSIERESSGYTTRKAFLFRHWAWIFYTLLFPGIVLVSIAWGLLLEWSAKSIPLTHLYFDAALAFMAICTLILYGVGTWLDR